VLVDDYFMVLRFVLLNYALWDWIVICGAEWCFMGLKYDLWCCHGNCEQSIKYGHHRGIVLVVFVYMFVLAEDILF